MDKTRIEVSKQNPHCIANITLQCSGALINVAAMTHATVGNWLSGHFALFAGTDLTTFRAFDYEAPDQALMARIVENALRGLDFSRAGA